MNTLIPVVIILGVLGFIVWKNWDNIKGVADKFKKPEPAQSEAPYKVPDPVPQAPVKVEAPVVEAPVADVPKVEPPQVKATTPEELHAQAQAVIARAYGATEETVRELDRRYAEYQTGRAQMFDAKGMQKWDDQYPTSVPNILVPEVKGYRHVIHLDKGGIKFLFFIPDADKWDYLRISTDVVLWAGKYGNNAGHLVVRDAQRNVVDERRLGLEGIVCLFSSRDRKGYTKLDRGTYEAAISYVGTDYPFVETYVDVIAK